MSIIPHAPMLHELVDDAARVLPLTVDQYHQMIRGGIIVEGAPFELLNGVVVHKDRSAAGKDPMTVGEHHAWAVKTVGKLDSKLSRSGCHMQTQQPVSLPPFNEPEPDGAIVRGTEDDYRERHPGASDVLCVIEVADATLRRDRTTKLAIYASASIAIYIIVNLPDVVIEVYADPIADKGRYATSTTLRPGQRLELPTASGKPLVVPVRSLLP